MEYINLFVCHRSQLLDFHASSDIFLDGHLVSRVKFHHRDVHSVEYHQNDGVRYCDIIGRNLKSDDDEIYHQEYGIARNDPPINSGAFLGQEIETALNNKLTEGSLLHHSRYADVTHTKEDGIHDNETLGCRVSKREKGCIDGISRELKIINI